ncbi:MAG: M1 family metallopeptidase, partial [candidate division Zixibacteria bacterium]
MKLRLTFIAVLILALSAGIFAQEISRDDFRKAEWEMKSRFWKYQQEKQDQNLTLDQSDYDVKYWELDIDVTNIQGEIVSGKVTMTSEPVVNGLSTVEYDLHVSLSADSVFMSGQPVSYDHSGHILEIDLDRSYDTGEQFTTVVYYHGQPPGGGWGSFSWDTHAGQPIISTLSEPEGAREWWPCKDIPHDKCDSADVKITVPDNLVGTSNGKLISDVDNGDGTRTFHWDISYPITTYLISLAISNYESFTDWYHPVEGDSMPIVNYVYPEHYDNAVEDLSITASVIEIFADLFGEYPFINEKYGHSIFPWGGAMEHQCNTSYGQGLIRGDHAYDWILVHELAHMWFGDMISCDTWPDIWTNEGFASYLEALWIEELDGHTAYLNYMRYNNGVNEPSGPIYDPNPL